MTTSPRSKPSGVQVVARPSASISGRAGTISKSAAKAVSSTARCCKRSTSRRPGEPHGCSNRWSRSLLASPTSLAPVSELRPPRHQKPKWRKLRKVQNLAKPFKVLDAESPTIDKTIKMTVSIYEINGNVPEAIEILQNNGDKLLKADNKKPDDHKFQFLSPSIVMHEAKRFSLYQPWL